MNMCSVKKFNSADAIYFISFTSHLHLFYIYFTFSHS
jgi:hypothetical protein